MAFNFNWSPLTADEDFYQRARDLLTTALNKSPKPPIIVDDILVTELNLGSVPPELEILEIGDLAEDRFRGIFKMCYSGDAFLTLRTRVQVRYYVFSLVLSRSQPISPSGVNFGTLSLDAEEKHFPFPKFRMADETAGSYWADIVSNDPIRRVSEGRRELQTSGE